MHNLVTLKLEAPAVTCFLILWEIKEAFVA